MTVKSWEESKSLTLPWFKGLALKIVITKTKNYGARPGSNQPPKSWNIDKLEINVMYFLIGKKFYFLIKLQLFLTQAIFKGLEKIPN